jgi:hypothetical protein
MASFYMCKPSTQPSPLSEHTENSCTLPWAVSTINKAALKVNDIHLKLDLAKITRFLDEKYLKEKERTYRVTFGNSPATNSSHDVSMD